MKRSKYDGQPREWSFGSRKRESDTWEVEAVSLKRAVRMFRVGCMFPHAHSEGRIAVEKPEEHEHERDHYLSSQPGSKVKVYVKVSKKHHGWDWKYVASIPVVDPDAEYDHKKIPASVQGVCETGPQGEGTDLITVDQDELRPCDAPRDLMAEAQVALSHKKRDLELMVSEMHHQMALMQDELKRRMRQVWMIDLFVGSKEEVHILRRGAPAPAGTKIAVHQRVLCMDEELAVYHFVHKPEQVKEFCAESLEDFDAWLLEGRNVDQIIPQEKGIVALRIRRDPKDRLQFDPASLGAMFRKMELEEADRMTYVLVRNGENLYRLWVDVKLWPRFFPRVDEWDWLTDRSWGSDKDRADEEAQRYAGGLLVVQGLVQRSDLLDPVDKSANVFAPDLDEHFTCLRNDESTGISDGETITWDSYRKWMNSRLKTGTRAMFTGRDSYGDSLGERTGIQSLCDWPEENAVFELRSEKPKSETSYYSTDKRPRFSFLYMPSDKAGTSGWSWAEKDREKRVRFFMFAEELWPVDHISWRVVRALLLDRSQRGDYYEFFPMLARWYRLNKKERRRERPFVDLVLRDSNFGEDDRPRAERVLRWWKVKNKYQRAVKKDEPKALRMCVRAMKRGDDPDDPEKTL